MRSLFWRIIAIVVDLTLNPVRAVENLHGGHEGLTKAAFVVGQEWPGEGWMMWKDVWVC